MWRLAWLKVGMAAIKAARELTGIFEDPSKATPEAVIAAAKPVLIQVSAATGRPTPEELLDKTVREILPLVKAEMAVTR